jgi:protein O-mannosyl-transferase
LILQAADDQIVTHSRGRALAGAAAAIVPVLAAVLVYLNALHNPFVYDDHHTVVDNTSIQRLWNLRGIVLHDVTRPIVNLSYAIDRRVWGPAPFGFHTTNLLLHALNVLLLFLFARATYRDAWVGSGFSRTVGRTNLMAFAAALLLAVHPMMTEAVGYISGRSEVLCGVFFFLALMAGRRWLRGDGMRWAVATILLWLASLASKEIAAMLPFVLALDDALVAAPPPDERRRRWLTVHLPLIGVAVVAGLVRIAILTRIESPGRAVAHWPYALVALDVMRRYIGLMVYPHNQTLFHAVPGIDGLFGMRAIGAVALVGLMVWIAWRLRRDAGTVSFGSLWFLLLLVPSAALTVLDQGEPMAEHRVYLASCGLFLAAGDGIGRLSAWAEHAETSARSIVPLLLTIVTLSFGFETIARNAVWSSPVSIWRESVTLAPTHYRPHLLLGEALQDEGRRDDAIQEYKTAIRLRPTDPTGYIKLGALLLVMGHVDEARQNYVKAVEVDPHNETARRGLEFLKQMSDAHGHDGDRG